MDAPFSAALLDAVVAAAADAAAPPVAPLGEVNESLAPRSIPSAGGFLAAFLAASSFFLVMRSCWRTKGTIKERENKEGTPTTTPPQAYTMPV